MKEDVIKKTLMQIRGVHAVMPRITIDQSRYAVIVFFEESSVEAVIGSPSDLDDLCDIIDCHQNDTALSEKVNLRYRFNEG